MTDRRHEELAHDEDGDPGVELLTGLYPSVAAVVAERDRLRAENARLDALHAEARLERIVERDRLTQGVQAAIDERDRLREALEMIAIPPVHVPDLSEGCEGCAGVARAALDGTDYNGPISVTPAQAVTGTLGPTSPEYQALMQQAMDLADEGDRLRGAVEAAQSLVEALDSNPIGEYGDAVCEAIDALDGKLNAAKEGDVSNVDPDSVRRMISEGRARQLDRAVDQIEELTAERDRLIGHLNEYARSCAAHVAERDRLRESVARYKAFAESEILDRVSAELGFDLRRQLEEGT